MSRPWTVELWRLAGVLLGGLIIGAILGRPVGGLVVALLAYLGWHLLQLYRVERWLREGTRLQPPEAGGIWGELCYHIQRLRQRERRRKRRLADILDRFQEAIAAMPDATVVLGRRGNIQWFNEAAKRLLGLRTGQDVGQHLSNLVRHPVFADYLARGGEGEGVQFPSPVDENLMLRARIIPYGEDQRLVLVRDVTHLHRVEQMRRDFVANASHELRTPITVIAGYLETLAEGDDPATREWQPVVGEMRHQARRMQRLVEDLMMLSRLESAEPPRGGAPVDVAAMAVSIRDDARALSGERNHVIELDCEEGLDLFGDYNELRSAFSNLVFNAVQYTPPGGRVRVQWYADADGAHFIVSDTGPGIPSSHIPRLTERFYRVDVGRSRQAGGTGLGLAIVKHVLNRHEGELRIESELGRGSTFACDFLPSQAGRRVASGMEPAS